MTRLKSDRPFYTPLSMTPADLAYPIGPYEKPVSITAEQLAGYIATLAAFPAQVRAAVASLSEAQLDTPYRPGGWTVRQVVHHCADSHMNSLIRFKLALTEPSPTIKPYFEARWAALPDSSMPLEPSLHLLEGLHARWVVLLHSLSAEQLARTFVHPEHGEAYRLDETIAHYAWHSRHHLAHITSLRTRMGW